MAGDTRRNGIILFAIGLLTLLAYLPLRHGDYIQDDHLAVEHNRIVEAGSLGEILRTSSASRSVIRQQEFSKLISVLETGGRDGMFTWERYGTWLDGRLGG